MSARNGTDGKEEEGWEEVSHPLSTPLLLKSCKKNRALAVTS
jgi:hypothetical protein